MYGGVRGRKTRVGEKLHRFPPTRFLGFLPNLHGLLRFAFSQVLEAKSRISFCKEKGNSFLPSVEQATH